MIRFVFKSSKVLDCPAATKDLKLNTKNRDAAIQAEHIQYGPLNVDEPGQYWIDIADYWNTTEKAAQKSLCGNCVAFDISPRMKDCMPGETSDDDGELGYCWMHHFKCHSARSCRTWAKGGPITEDNKSTEWQKKNEGSLEEKKNDKMSPDEAIAKEGGALGFSKWEELTGMSREELEKYVKDNDHIKIHKHGDIIDTRSLSEETLEEKKKKKQQKGKKRAKKTAKRKSKKKKGDRCTRIAKRKYDVWPSAYASGAVVKCRQGKIWKGVKENFSITDAELKGIVFEETEKVLKEKCWDGYVQKGIKKKGGEDVPNCVLPEEKELTEAELEEKKKKKKQQKGKKRAAKVAKRKSKKKKKAKTDYSKEKKSGLHGWFSRQGGKGKSKGWVDCNTCRTDKKTGKKTCKSCGRKEGEKRAKYPSCRPTPSACGTKGKGKKWGKTK